MGKARDKKGNPGLYGNIVAVALLLALAVVSTYICSLACLIPKRYAVTVGQPAPATIRASQTLNDEAATEALRQSAMDSVQPVYEIDQDLVSSLETQAADFFADLNEVRIRGRSMAATESPTQAEWEALLTEENVATLGSLTEPALDKEALLGVLMAGESELAMLRDIVLPKITTALAGGLAEESIERVRTAAIAEVNASTSLPSGLKHTGELALTAYLQSTYTVDESATEEARQAAAAAVTPVQVLERGDVIVNEGAIITQTHMVLLNQLDMVAESGAQDGYIYLGTGLYTLLAYGIFAACLYMLQPGIFRDFNRMLIMGLLLIVMPPLSLLCNMLDVHITPLPLAAMLIAILVGERAGICSAVLLSLLSAMLASRPGSAFSSDALSMLLFVLCFGITATYALRRVQTRGAIIAAAGMGGIAGAVCLMAVYIMIGSSIADILINAAWVLLSAALSGLLVVGSLSIWENLFDIATPARLNELLNTSNPLLKQLMYEAPGTYQHSMNVAALAEGAAERIGADALLARVGACYHDVGKLRRPLYFMENQQGTNIHDTLAPEESAAIIIAHQKDGATILSKNKMPSAVIRIAAEHHGNSLVAYFYYKAQKLSGGAVDAKKFRYPGNRPSTREGAIVMLADCCEAAVRSLGECTKEAREEMVHKVIWSKLTDGPENLLSNAPLTFHELSEIEKSFLRTFSGIMHDRIEYPEEKKP